MSSLRHQKLDDPENESDESVNSDCYDSEHSSINDDDQDGDDNQEEEEEVKKHENGKNRFYIKFCIDLFNKLRPESECICG